MNLSKYNTILWDFDGVIVDSNSVREEGFKLVLKDFPSSEVDKLIAYHNVNGGLSRYVKFRYFFEQIRGEKISDEEVLTLAESFSQIMKRLLVDKSILIDETLDFIKYSFNKGIQMHIVSGSDGIELNYLCKKLELAKYFLTIQGSPTPKKQLVRNLIESNQINPVNACLIGDSINDYEAAQENKVDFIGYNNQSLKTYCLFYIPTFTSLLN